MGSKRIVKAVLVGRPPSQEPTGTGPGDPDTGVSVQGLPPNGRQLEQVPTASGSGGLARRRWAGRQQIRAAPAG